MRRAFFFIGMFLLATTSLASIPRASTLADASPTFDPLPETRIRVSDVLAPFEQPAPSPLSRALHQAYEQASTTSASGLGRFLSVDPRVDLKRALEQPQMWNRYAYGLNNPVRFIDPTGMLTYEAEVLGAKVRVHIADDFDEKLQQALKTTIDAAIKKINGGKEDLTKQEKGIVTLIKALEVGREDSGVNTQTGQFTVFAPHLTMQSPDAFAADYVHDSKHVFNGDPLNPLYTNWFVGGRRQNFQELDERDASEFAVAVGMKIGLDPDALWKYQEPLIDSICNYQWWRDH
jgi:hypothetical protein